MYNPHLSAEQREMRDTVRDFVTREIKPVALAADRLERADPGFPRELLVLASQIGLRALALPETMGGAGADNLTCCIVAEELAAGDVGLAHTLMHTSTASRLLFGQSMTDEQRARFLPAFLADDDFHLAIARAEADDGGWHYPQPTLDEPPIRATAVRAGDDWVVNGACPFVPNAPLAKLLAVEVIVTEDARSAQANTVLVTPGMPGLTITELAADEAGAESEMLCRWHHGRAGTLTFADCRIPAANQLGAEARHVGSLAQALNLGVGRAAYEAALDYAKLRVQGGRPIIEHQAIATILADIAIRIEVARNTVWKAAWAADCADASRDDADALQTIARVFTAETMHQVALDAAEVFGAMGVMRDMPMQKYVRDAMIFLHGHDVDVASRLRLAETIAQRRGAAPAQRKAAA